MDRKKSVSRKATLKLVRETSGPILLALVKVSDQKWSRISVNALSSALMKRFADSDPEKIKILLNEMKSKLPANKAGNFVFRETIAFKAWFKFAKDTHQFLTTSDRLTSFHLKRLRHLTQQFSAELRSKNLEKLLRADHVDLFNFLVLVVEPLIAEQILSLKEVTDEWPVIKICHCGKIFYSLARDPRIKYCSVTCQALPNKIFRTDSKLKRKYNREYQSKNRHRYAGREYGKQKAETKTQIAKIETHTLPTGKSKKQSNSK